MAGFLGFLPNSGKAIKGSVDSTECLDVVKAAR
jgi:hypothetical protein